MELPAPIYFVFLTVQHPGVNPEPASTASDAMLPAGFGHRASTAGGPERARQRLSLFFGDKRLTIARVRNYNVRRKRRRATISVGNSQADKIGERDARRSYAFLGSTPNWSSTKDWAGLGQKTGLILDERLGMVGWAPRVSEFC